VPERTGHFRSWGQTGCAISLPATAALDPTRTSESNHLEDNVQAPDAGYPSRPFDIYMLSTENMVPDDKGVVEPFPPHVMFYAPYLTNADLGSDGQAGAGPAFVASEGTPYALIIVPVETHTSPGHAH
jgi:hypothetical protein